MDFLIDFVFYVLDATLIDRTTMLNQNRYNYYNCLLFSLVLRRNYDSKVELYAAQDPNLKDWPWNRLMDNFVDIGIFNRFWFLEKAFENYDIKQEEFKTEKLNN
uniref:Uncharacterized protein n=1 Tax=Panagrolaimus sp. JU765 TaxID=591449 RepID=A0AC34RES5_9BILA